MREDNTRIILDTHAGYTVKIYRYYNNARCVWARFGCKCPAGLPVPGLCAGAGKPADYYPYSEVRSGMPRLSIEARRRVIALRGIGYSVQEIRKRLAEENISISLQSLFNLLRKYKDTGHLLDLPRKAKPKKLNDEMRKFLNEALSENDELTARKARSLLMDKWPDLRVSIPTIKRIRKELGWVCTRPHYCQLLRDVSTDQASCFILYK